MDIINYDKIELEFEEFSLILPSNIIEKFQVEKVEQLIEKKYNPEDLYDVYIVINRILAEKLWERELPNKFKRNNRFFCIRLFDKRRWNAIL